MNIGGDLWEVRGVFLWLVLIIMEVRESKSGLESCEGYFIIVFND